MNNTLLFPILSLLLLVGCRHGAPSQQNMTVAVDFEYLRSSAAGYATRYLALTNDEMERQYFLLDVRAKIDRLAREVSPTHARIFEEAFADSARLTLGVR